MLELALITPVLAMIVFGVVDLSRAYQLQIRLEAAAREGANHATLYPDEVDCTGDLDIAGRVAAEDPDLVGIDGYDVAVYVEAPDGTTTSEITGCNAQTTDPGARVRVEVRATHHILTPMIGSVVGNTLTVDGSAEIEVLG